MQDIFITLSRMPGEFFLVKVPSMLNMSWKGKPFQPAPSYWALIPVRLDAAIKNHPVQENRSY